jgi:GGDEF domain-containing protein
MEIVQFDDRPRSESAYERSESGRSLSPIVSELSPLVGSDWPALVGGAALSVIVLLMFIAVSVWLFEGAKGAALAYLITLLLAVVVGLLGKLRVSHIHARSRAMLDEVTGLPTREHFLRELDLACRHAEFGAMAGVLCVQIDTMDAALVEGNSVETDEIVGIAAGCLVSNVRSGDCVARLDGARFAILQRLILSSDSCDGLKVRLAGCLSSALDHAKIGRSMSIRIGTALASRDAIVPGMVLEEAENALLEGLVVTKNGTLQSRGDPKEGAELCRAVAANEFLEQYQFVFDFEPQRV